MAQNELAHSSASSRFFRPLRAQWTTLREVATGEVHGRSLFGIEYLFLLGVCGALLFMPSVLVRGVSEMVGGRWRKTGIEVYAVLKPAFALFVLFFGLYTSTLCTLVVAILLLDLYLSLSGLVFLRHLFSGPASRGRSILLLGINFIEAVTAYAVFYGHFGSVAHMSGYAIPSTGPGPIDFLYFSCATAVAVGYGDLLVVTGIGKALAIFQMLSSLGFVSIFLSTFVSDFAIDRHRSPLGQPRHGDD